MWIRILQCSGHLFSKVQQRVNYCFKLCKTLFLSFLERLLSEIAFIEASELLALSRLGATVRLRYFGNQEQLSLSLSQRNVQLAEPDKGWTLRHVPDARNARAR